ncbi:MAG: MFS transporter [Bacillota bacterium]|nr:MFS transporter [Bacillota bacterium]
MSARRVDAVFLLVTCLFFLSQYTYAPFLTPYVGVLGGSLAMTGLVAGSYGALQFLLRIPLGLWSDRLARRKPFVVAGVLLAGISALGLGLASTPCHLLFFRSLSGVAAATWVLFTVFYTSLFPSAETGKRTGLLTFAASSGQLAGNLAGGFLAERGGWTAPFFGAAMAGALTVPLVLAVPETRTGEQRKTGEAVEPALRQCARPAILEPSLLALLTHFIFYATILGFTPVYVTSLGLSKLTLGVLSTASGLAYVLGTLLATRAEMRQLPWRFLVGASFAAMALAVWATPFSRTAGQLAAGFIALGFCRGTTYPVLMAAALRASPPAYTATAVGLFQAIYAVGMFAGPALAGVVAQRLGLPAVFVFCAVLAVAGLLWCSRAAGTEPAVAKQECPGAGQK